MYITTCVLAICHQTDAAVGSRPLCFPLAFHAWWEGFKLTYQRCDPRRVRLSSSRGHNHQEWAYVLMQFTSGGVVWRRQKGATTGVAWRQRQPIACYHRHAERILVLCRGLWCHGCLASHSAGPRGAKTILPTVRLAHHWRYSRRSSDGGLPGE